MWWLRCFIAHWLIMFVADLAFSHYSHSGSCFEDYTLLWWHCFLWWRQPTITPSGSDVSVCCLLAWLHNIIKRRRFEIQTTDGLFGWWWCCVKESVLRCAVVTCLKFKLLNFPVLGLKSPVINLIFCGSTPEVLVWGRYGQLAVDDQVFQNPESYS